MKNKVSKTFSDKQNQIIKFPINKPLIITGVPGSGKTTMAFERIHYLIENEKLDYKNIIFLTSNDFFIDHISNTFLDTDTKKIEKYTFEQFTYKILKKKICIIEEKDKIVSLYDRKIEHSDKNELNLKIKETKLKSSLEYKKIIDKYLEYFANKLIPKKDFILANVRIIKASTVRTLFFETYKELPFEERLNKIKNDIYLKIQENVYDIIKQAIEKRSVDIQELMKKDLKMSEIKSQKTKIFNKTEKLLQLLYKSDPKIVDLYFGEIKLKNARIRYKDFVSNFAYENIKDTQLASYLTQNTRPYLERSRYKFDDLPAIIYIQLKIFGNILIKDIKHIVIDNIQDYSEFQFFVLKEILNSDSFTILGDISQGVFFNRRVNDWNDFISTNFSESKPAFIQLDKNYTLTKEIATLANRIISKAPKKYKDEFINFTETEIDTSESLKVYSVKNYEFIARECAKKIRAIEKIPEYKTLAIIGRDLKECRSIRKAIGNYVYEPLLIEDSTLIKKNKVFIIPSYLTKGMYFDYVIIVNASSENYCKDILDIKSLYLAITRAKKKLEIYFIKNISKLMIE